MHVSRKRNDDESMDSTQVAVFVDQPSKMFLSFSVNISSPSAMAPFHLTCPRPIWSVSLQDILGRSKYGHTGLEHLQGKAPRGVKNQQFFTLQSQPTNFHSLFQKQTVSG